ncbi:LLM class flavin-dependent oxidoreductase [Actinomycetospora sp. TBRC 11914]|uniref:LLM class flavin-dependent oxidoreductase n=1 Tax=Actinomycetospora sp. TBRC 11914 TaxID=2729387 RepID=UPI00145EB745|nr:LLM class flavin-dependent oxidoreductase [Actinomycetospora sp. TBRC 11914]NMO91530.1 LLM class flavin-dependent oxidoreductase [Actinomycetospora sp. TBRC 11914]
MPAVPLSVLDLAPVPPGGTAADALRHTLELARAAEAAGYRRYWVAEHHLTPGVASSSTPVLVGLVASATSTIRVGSGAVQMPMTPPLQIAEQFGTVAAVFPDRVDLGLGRFDIHKILAMLRARSAPPADAPPPPPSRHVDGLLIPAPGRVPGADFSGFGTLAERMGVSGDAPDHAAQVREIVSYLEGTATRADGTPIHAMPAEGADLQVWLLGSSPGVSAQTAGALGLPFAVNYHTLPTTVLETVAAYRAAFVPSPGLDRPHVMVSADVVVAPTDDAARELAAPYGQWVLDIRTGRGAQPYVTPEQARARAWTDAERAGVADRVDTQFVGSPTTVRDDLEILVKATGADELLVTTITTDPADRVRSHELLAQAWG